MFTYKINLSFDLGEAVNEVGDIVKSFNDIITSYGINDKFSIRSKGFSMLLNCDRKLNQKERCLIKKILIDEFNTKFVGWNFKIESFRGKSGKSCSKSKSR